MQAALFNASLTISGYYQAEVNHDMPQLPWHWSWGCICTAARWWLDFADRL